MISENLHALSMRLYPITMIMWYCLNIFCQVLERKNKKVDLETLVCSLFLSVDGVFRSIT